MTKFFSHCVLVYISLLVFFTVLHTCDHGTQFDLKSNHFGSLHSCLGQDYTFSGATLAFCTTSKKNGTCPKFTDKSSLSPPPITDTENSDLEIGIEAILQEEANEFDLLKEEEENFYETDSDFDELTDEYNWTEEKQTEDSNDGDCDDDCT